MYSKIYNPETGRMVSITGIIGKRVLKKYLRVLVGGMSQLGGRQVNTPNRRLLVFYAHFPCVHCKNLEPIINEAQKQIQNEPALVIETMKSTPDILAKYTDYNISAFPTIILEVNGEKVDEFNGERTVKALIDFLKTGEQ